MSCYRPVKAFRSSSGGVCFSQTRRDDVVGDIKLACRHCIGCLRDRAAEWAVRAQHEAQMHEGSCVLTLTIARDEDLPLTLGDAKRLYQLFLKRLRDDLGGRRIRYFGCHERGERGGRSHYHIVIFGWRPDDLTPWIRASHGKSAQFRSATVERLWPLGFSTVGEMCSEAANYVASYVVKKLGGQRVLEAVDSSTGEISLLVPDFGFRSTHPGIGASWFAEFGATDVVRAGCVVVKGGCKTPVPSYYQRLMERGEFAQQLEDLKQQAAIRSMQPEVAADRTPERLAVRERVYAARTRRVAERSL